MKAKESQMEAKERRMNAEAEKMEADKEIVSSNCSLRNICPGLAGGYHK